MLLWLLSISPSSLLALSGAILRCATCFRPLLHPRHVICLYKHTRTLTLSLSHAHTHTMHCCDERVAHELVRPPRTSALCCRHSVAGHYRKRDIQLSKIKHTKYLKLETIGVHRSSFMRCTQRRRVCIRVYACVRMCVCVCVSIHMHIHNVAKQQHARTEAQDRGGISPVNLGTLRQGEEGEHQEEAPEQKRTRARRRGARKTRKDKEGPKKERKRQRQELRGGGKARQRQGPER